MDKKTTKKLTTKELIKKAWKCMTNNSTDYPKEFLLNEDCIDEMEKIVKKGTYTSPYTFAQASADIKAEAKARKEFKDKIKGRNMKGDEEEYRYNIGPQEIYRIAPETTNPKDIAGAKKVPISLLPTEGIVQGAKAMKHGADKYGPFNWRDKKIQYVIYLDAILRHVILCIDGEDIDKDSGLHPLAHVIAGASIVLDALKHDCLIDNRPKRKE